MEHEKIRENREKSSRSDAKRNGSTLAANLTTDPIGDEHVSLEKNEGKTRGWGYQRRIRSVEGTEEGEKKKEDNEWKQ